MRNTGYKQARIAKKVTSLGHLPLNEDGEIIDQIAPSVENADRRKQAILLLKGEDNPDPERYKVVGYFEVGQQIGYYKNGKISGNTDTRVYQPQSCPPSTLSFIRVKPSVIELDVNAPGKEVTIESSHAWMISYMPESLNASSLSGNSGTTTITLSPNYFLSNDKYEITFSNENGDETKLTILSRKEG